MTKGILILLLISLAVNAEFEVFSKSFVSNDFNDLDGWAALHSARGANVYNVCAGARIVGGDGVFGTKASMVKNFKLPPHYQVQIKVQFWKVDSWDNEKFHVFADDQRIFEKGYAYNQGQQLCGRGGDWGEVRENLDLKIKHVNPTLNVVFTSTLNEAASNESWAIRDFYLLIERCPEACDTCRNGDANDCSFWQLYKWNWTKLTQVSAEGWTVEKGSDGSTECAGIHLLGGYGKFGNGAVIFKKFDMPPHYRIKVKLTFAKIDSWDNEEGSISLDGTKIWARRFQYHEGYTNSVCGAVHNNWAEMFVGVDAEGGHTGEKVEVRITSTLNQGANDESWGVRDFFLYFAKCPKSCQECKGPAPSDCSKCEGNYAMQDGECKAMNNYIMVEQEFMQQRFAGLAGWTLTDNVGGKQISDCGGTSLVGGYGILGAKGAARKSWNLPAHKKLRIQVQLWKIDSWDDEFLYIQLDGQKIWQKQLGFGNGGRPICGQGHANWNELIIDVDEIVHHSEGDATIVISSTLNQHANDESWGFREFRLFYEFKEPCAIFYTECNYKGAAYEFCGQSPDFRKDNVPPVIRSIKLPPQARLTIWDKEEYGGKKVVYTEDQPCIKGFEWSLLQTSNTRIEHPEQWQEAENLRQEN